jgi:hypothetical protein
LPLLQSARGNAGTASRWFLLSWDWGPCRRCTCLSSTPGSRLRRASFLRTSAARRRSCSALVVLHHLDGFLRVAVAGLLHPATGQGFAAFRVCRCGGRPKAASMAGDSSRGAVRTLRRVPLVSSRKRITAAVAFLSLPSCPAMAPAETGGRADRDPRRRGGRTPWVQPGRGSSQPRGVGRPIPEGKAAPSSEERGAGVPRGTGTTRLRRVRRPSPAGGGVAPRSGVALPCRGGDAQPCREEVALFRRAGVAEPGGKGRAGLRRVPAAESRGGARGSEELRVRVPRRRVRRSEERRACHLGGGPPRPGREVLGGSRRPCGAPKSSGGFRGDPGFTPEGWDGVRGRDPDAVMLRSACADPHITEHAASEGASSNGVT